MYVQYKVNVSENQVDTLKDTIRLKKTSSNVIKNVIQRHPTSPKLHATLDKTSSDVIQNLIERNPRSSKTSSKFIQNVNQKVIRHPKRHPT